MHGDTDGQQARWSEVRALFERCLDTPGERERLLAAASAAVRREVQSLLGEHTTAGARMDADIAHQRLLESATTAVQVGQRIGAFRVVGVIGRGGMGTVFLAEQESPRRRVAVKLLSAAMAIGESERRFRHEAELLGRLRHPGIAQVLEAGVHEQQTPFGTARWPWFAMEYVEGACTLSAWAAQHRGDGERTLVRAFLPVCLAVQHAHERGVVHRDIKPQNVLFGEGGEVKVIDFGIARSVGIDDDSSRGLTRTGELVGTLRYMSPEQVRGDKLAIDTRTDVHALGVVLFELLTGRMPLPVEGKSLPETARILCEQAPVPLRALLPDADADLELVLQTAMAKEPDRRYATAGALAEDLGRYLRRDPINARAPSLGYQLRMFARRRRGLVVAVAALLLVSTIGGITSLAYAYRAHRAERRAVDEGEQKVGAMRRVFELSMRSVLDLPEQLAGVPEATRLLRERVERAVQQLEFVEQNAPLDAAMHRSLARAYHQLGKVQGLSDAGHTGDRAAAMDSFARGVAHAEAVLATRVDDPAALLQLAELELARGLVVFQIRRDLDVVEAHWDRAAGVIARLRELPSVDARQVDAVRVLHLSHMANFEQTRGNGDRAVQLFREAFALRQGLVDAADAEPEDLCDLGSLLRGIAFVEDGRGRPIQAHHAYLEAYEVLRPLEELPDHVEGRQLLATVRTALGYSLASQGRTADGEQHMRWAYLELERLVGTDPGNAALETSLGAACQRLADHLAIQAKYAPERVGATQLYTEARQIALRGLEVSRPLRDRTRDMMTVFLVGECERLLALCDEALR